MRSIIMALCLVFSSGAFAESYRDAVTIKGADIQVTRAAWDHIGGEGLLAILDQAASAPVFEGDTQVGYALSDIDAGSIFETGGLLNGDVVLEIAGMELSDPKRAVEILRYARGLDDFEALVRRDGALLRFRVRVKGG